MLPRRDFIKQTGVVVTGTLLSVHLLSHSTKVKMKEQMMYDVIIIGGSYSGLAAGMALGRALRKALIIDGGNPCNKQTPHSHNFLTNDGKTPKEISSLARQQVRKYKTVSYIIDMAIAGSKRKNGFEVQVQSGRRYAARKLVFATGIKDIMPTIPGFAESWGISALHCPYCHGYEVKHKKTGILANGDLAIEMSSLISNWTDDLTVFTHGKSLLNEQQKAKLDRHGIQIIETEIKRLDHEKGHIKNVIFRDETRTSLRAIYARLPFVQHSSIPQTLGCEFTPEGYIKIDSNHKTTIPGVYACGDNVTRMRTVANAVSMGATTGMMVNKELIEEDF